jgi:RNA polymerase sigma-70 factor (ECF subfamily)
LEVPSEVIEGCKAGDQESFKELIRLTHRAVYSLALRMVGDPEDAADVSQETYLKLIRAIKQFRGEAKFSTWLYRVTSSAARRCADRFRGPYATSRSGDGGPGGFE